ncbi:MAG: hypothetical protein ABI824_06250 [Acidobacteriota bacterium]
MTELQIDEGAQKGIIMRAISWIMLSLAAAGLATAQTEDGSFELKPRATVLAGPQTKLAAWIWSDKYTYQPGQGLTLRNTIKTNGDLYPYTSFVYVQNNQTGLKKYFPGLTTTVTDVNGKTATQGFDAARLTDQTKQVLIGSGGKFPAYTIPNEPGMSTIVYELRDYTGNRVIKTMYMKVGVYTKTATISGTISASKTLTNDTEWHIQGLTFVNNGAVLTIEPGTFVFGEPGTTTDPSTLVITREGTINAAGTAARPIVMTSKSAFGSRKAGDWGGLVVLGKAPVNLAAGASNGNPDGQGYIEGFQTTPNGLYGGTDPTHNCGTMTYMRVEYAGSILGVGNEINSFTWGGCGSKTVAHHLQAIYGLDDTFEWFGGTMNASYLVGGLSRDDYTDYQLGFTGKLQYIIGYYSPDSPGNRGIEGDNSEFNPAALPWSNPTISNATYIGSRGNGFDEGVVDGVYLRRGTRGSFNNIVVMGFPGNGLKLADANTVAEVTAGNLKVNSILMWDNNVAGTQAATLAGNTPDSNSFTFLNGTPAGAAQNIVVADPQLTRPREYSDPDFVGLFSSPIYRAGWTQMPDDGFFDQTARFVGGISPDNNWLEGWTSFLVEQDVQ